MKTKQIPRDEWIGFFNNLSRKQEGWEVTLEVFGPEIGDQVEQRHMFLTGATAEVTDQGDTIELMMGGKPSGHVTHVVRNPKQVEMQQTDVGIDSVLSITSGDGTTTLLHLS